MQPSLDSQTFTSNQRMLFAKVNAGFIPTGGSFVNGSAQPTVCLIIVSSVSPGLEQFFDSGGTGDQELS